jgi:hypothetical protein
MLHGNAIDLKVPPLSISGLVGLGSGRVALAPMYDNTRKTLIIDILPFHAR